MEYFLLEETGTLELQHPLEMRKQMVCFCSAIQKPGWGKNIEIYAELLVCNGEYLLVKDAYASTLQGSMSQDQYDSLQLAA